LWRCGTYCIINIESVRRITNADYFSTEFVEHFGRNTIGCTMCAIDHNLHAVQIQIIREGTLAKLDIAPCRIIHTSRPAQTSGGHALHRLVKLGFYGQLDGVRQLGALRRKKLDAIIFIRIMRSREHHTGLKTQGTREVSHRRRWNRAAEHNIYACGSKAGFQGCFQHVARNTCVFTNQYCGVFNGMVLASR